MKAITLILDLRESAKSVVKMYLVKKMRKLLIANLALALLNVVVVLILFMVSNLYKEILIFQLFTSLVCIGLIIFNSYFLITITIPELKNTIKIIKSKKGYALKYLLGITVFDLLIDFKIITLVLLIIFAVGTKWGILGGFSIISPWVDLFN